MTTTTMLQAMLAIIVVQWAVIIALIFFRQKTVPLAMLDLLFSWARQITAITPTIEDDRAIDQLETTYRGLTGQAPSQVKTKPLPEIPPSGISER